MRLARPSFQIWNRLLVSGCSSPSKVYCPHHVRRGSTRVRSVIQPTRIPHRRVDSADARTRPARPASAPDTPARHRRVARPRRKRSRRPPARPRRLRRGTPDPPDRRRHSLPVRLRRGRRKLLAPELLREGWNGALLRHLPGPGPSRLSLAQGWEIPRRNPRRHRRTLRLTCHPQRREGSAPPCHPERSEGSAFDTLTSSPCATSISPCSRSSLARPFLYAPNS